MSPAIQVYTEKASPRLDYSLDLVFKTILNCDYMLTDKPDSDRPLINYSDNRSIGGIFIKPEGLLFQTGIKQQDIWVAHIDGLPLFFQQPPEAGFIIDIFSFCFYLVTRYEEYLPFTRDEHGRFAAESSLAYKHGFLQIPVVDLWVRKFANTISILYPLINFPIPKYKSLITVDVDVPFAFKGKGLLRNLGGLFRDMLAGENVKERINCMLRMTKDPYDTYDYLNSQAKINKLPVLYFFTAGNRSRYDKNPRPTQSCYKRLIKLLSKEHAVGLHPSYKSRGDTPTLRKELERLEIVSSSEIKNIRKHFLLLSFPESYQEINELGLRNDYTLGYAREYGFRASIARPFLFYDLLKDETSQLMLYPFQYMDGTLQQFKRLTPEEAVSAITKIVKESMAVGGYFISLWHNTSLTEEDGWEGWRYVFEEGLKIQSGAKTNQ